MKFFKRTVHYGINPRATFFNVCLCGAGIDCYETPASITLKNVTCTKCIEIMKKRIGEEMEPTLEARVKKLEEKLK